MVIITRNRTRSMLPYRFQQDQHEITMTDRWIGGLARLSIGNTCLIGREITSILEETRQEGIHIIRLDGETLSNGLYLLRLVTEEGIHVQPVVFQR